MVVPTMQETSRDQENPWKLRSRSAIPRGVLRSPGRKCYTSGCDVGVSEYIYICVCNYMYIYMCNYIYMKLWYKPYKPL